MPEVELPALIEVGLVDVGLDEICARTAIGVGLLLLDLILNLRQSATILDVLAPIAELARFDNPPRKTFFASFVVLSQKREILLVFKASSDMEGVGQILIFHSFEIDVGLHCFVECFFIADDSAELKVVCYFVDCYLFGWNFLYESLVHVFICFFLDSPS